MKAKKYNMGGMMGAPAAPAGPAAPAMVDPARAEAERKKKLALMRMMQAKGGGAPAPGQGSGGGRTAGSRPPRGAAAVAPARRARPPAAWPSRRHLHRRNNHARCYNNALS